MANKDLINIGSAPDSGTGDTIRKGGLKINNLFADIYQNFGDNPIGNDPEGKNYGYRKIYSEGEYKVGELFGAGKFRRVVFQSDSDNATKRSDGSFKFHHNNEGYFIKDSDGIIYSDNNTTVPAAYDSKEWYFLSRGEQIVPDLSKMDSDYFHCVLPLAKAGDRIIIRDSLGHINQDKPLSLWTTPYEWQSVSQINEWITNTPEANMSPDSDSFPSINHAKILNPGASVATNASLRTAQITNSDIVAMSTFEKVPFAGSNGASLTPNVPVSQITFDEQFTQVECNYLGIDKGWTYTKTIISNAGDTSLRHTFDDFIKRDWFKWTQPDLLDSDSIILQNQYLLPVMSSKGQRIFGTNGKTMPVFKVYQDIGYDSDEFGIKLQNFFSSYETANSENVIGDGNDNLLITDKFDSDSSMQRKYRRSQIASGNGTYRVGVNQTIDKWFNEVTLPSVCTKDGMLILISNYPFDGRVEIFVKGNID